MENHKQLADLAANVEFDKSSKKKKYGLYFIGCLVVGCIIFGFYQWMRGVPALIVEARVAELELITDDVAGATYMSAELRLHNSKTTKRVFITKILTKVISHNGMEVASHNSTGFTTINPDSDKPIVIKTTMPLLANPTDERIILGMRIRVEGTVNDGSIDSDKHGDPIKFLFSCYEITTKKTKSNLYTSNEVVKCVAAFDVHFD